MNNNGTGVFKLKLSENRHEIAYLQLPTYPRDNQMRTSKSVRLHELLGAYEGPDVVFDFDQEGILVGIEIITDNFDDSDDKEQV